MLCICSHLVRSIFAFERLTVLASKFYLCNGFTLQQFRKSTGDYLGGFCLTDFVLTVSLYFDIMACPVCIDWIMSSLPLASTIRLLLSILILWVFHHSYNTPVSVLCLSVSSMKYWTCCNRKTSDFDNFLNQEGCATGKHVWVKSKVKKQQPTLHASVCVRVCACAHVCLHTWRYVHVQYRFISHAAVHAFH